MEEQKNSMNASPVQAVRIKMNRSIQAERIFGILKWNKFYKRLFRRGLKNTNLELTLIFCGFNLCKYHNKKQQKELVA